MSPEPTKFFQGQRILVTGASGFIGWHVANELARAGACVRVLARGEAPDCEGFEVVKGDLLDPSSLGGAIDGCRYLFHVAGDYRFWASDRRQIYRNNVEATANILNAAGAAGVEKIVCTSTPGILARTPGEIADESVLAHPDELEGPYKSAKFAAYLEAQKWADRGAPIVTVLPTAPIGPRDIKPTPTGMIIVQFLNGKIPFLARTGLNFVDVRQVARGHLLAMMLGKKGERYLLGGVNLWLGEFLQKIAAVTGRTAPRFHCPYPVSYLAACASELMAGITREPPFVTLESVRMSRGPHFFSSAKAESLLGYEPGCLDDALRAALDYFRARGLVR